MKKILLIALVAIVSFAAINSVAAQNKSETTIIVVRHGEKDTVGGNDPILTAAGKARAEKLITVFKDVQPDEMYSTPYVRTMETIKPWATKAGIDVKKYDPRNLKAFADELKQLKGKTVVVTGHSNTNPALVNFLLGADKYKALADSVYSTIYVVTVKADGTATEKIIEY